MAKIGFMSFAHPNAQLNAVCIRQVPGAVLQSIWDDDLKRGANAANESGAKFYENLEGFLASDIEGVVISSETTKHRHFAEQAALAGKWILCENPLASTMEDAQAIVNACKHTGMGLGVAFTHRYAPTVAALRDQICKGDYGQILAGNCAMNIQFPEGWRTRKSSSGGGATLDCFIHLIDLLRWMLGKECVKVFCENGPLLGRDTDVDDTGMLHVEMEGGVIISCQASWSRPASYPIQAELTMDFVGERGCVTLDAFNQKVCLYQDDPARAAWVNYGGDMHLGLMTEFAAAVDERREPAVTGLDGLKALQAALAAYQSAAACEVAGID